MRRNRAYRRVLVVVLLCFACAARGQSTENCSQVRLGTVGWLDAGSAVSIASAVLQGLGYQPTHQRLDTPTILSSLKNGDLDAFLEILVPTMGGTLKPYILDGSVKLVRKNLAGTKYSIAVNSPARNRGIARFDDLAEHAESLSRKIYGVEPGADGNLLIRAMIESNRYGVGDFELVESSEESLVQSIARANRENRPMAFLAFEPHPMNVRFELTWLTGGEAVFGDNFGGADAYTGIRTTLTRDCPNLATFLENLEFTLPMINEVMTAILELKAHPLVASVAWIRQHPSVLDRWLDGVVSIAGQPGRKAVGQFMGLEITN